MSENNVSPYTRLELYLKLLEIYVSEIKALADYMLLRCISREKYIEELTFVKNKMNDVILDLKELT